MNELTTSWYQKLIEDLKLIAYSHLIVGKWEMGKRINQDKGKLNRFEYGDKKVETIAKDLGISTREIWRWMQFAEKCHDVTQLKEKPWRWIVSRYLPKHSFERSSVTLEDRFVVSSYGENIYFLSKKQSENRWDDHLIDEDDNFPTMTCLSRFFHKSTNKEFTLREYARVQTFPDEYKFVGSYDMIKTQIGNAVAPDMAKYIGQELKGSTFGDLFAGCGGLSYGLKLSGKKAVWAVEKNEKWAITYKVNHSDTNTYINDIKTLDPALALT